VGERDWQKLLAEKDARIAELAALVEELLARLGKNSLNSSLAPSSDDAGAKKKRRDQAAKHARRSKKEARRKNRSKRSMFPPEMVTSSEEHAPCGCDEYGRRFRKRDLLPEPQRIQQFDLPPLRPLVQEIRLYSGHCPDCDVATAAPRPASANASKVGPGLRALILLMVGRFHLSKRDALAFLSEVLSTDISIGLLSKIERQSTETLEAPYQEAVDATKGAPAVYADETGWSHGGVPGWLWCATTGHVTRFLIDTRRDKNAARALVGEHKGVTVSDRWSAYTFLARRQVCWAHLERNARALTERGSAAKRVGDRVVAFIRKMFKLWHRFLEDVSEILWVRVSG
jgi:transposase